VIIPDNLAQAYIPNLRHLPVMPDSVSSQLADVREPVVSLPELNQHPPVIDLDPVLALLQMSSWDSRPERQRMGCP
jgi:hypothetical protein